MRNDNDQLIFISIKCIIPVVDIIIIIFNYFNIYLPIICKITRQIVQLFHQTSFPIQNLSIYAMLSSYNVLHKNFSDVGTYVFVY